MTSLQSFEYAFERETAAGTIIQVLGHKVCEGLVTASWPVPQLNGTCILNRYDQRQIYQDGETKTIPTPFYLLHAIYKDEGRDALIMIDFEDHFSIPRQCKRRGPQPQQTEEIAWDDAMGVCDEVLRAGLTKAQLSSALPADQPSLRLAN